MLCITLAACGAPAPNLAGAGNMVTEQKSTERLVVARGESFTCTPTRVWDGDGPIWCAEGPCVRLAGIAAREMDGSCRPGHPCPAASAEAAKAALVALLSGSRATSREGHALVAGPMLTCVSNGGARGERTGASCALPDGRDLSCEMMRSRTVERWARYDTDGLLTLCR